jgi:hypothetical protein
MVVGRIVLIVSVASSSPSPALHNQELASPPSSEQRPLPLRLTGVEISNYATAKVALLVIMPSNSECA